MWIFQGDRDACNKVLHGVCSVLSSSPASESKSKKPCHPFQTPFSHRFTLPIAFSSAQALHWWPTEGRREVASSLWATDSQQQCPPSIWRHTGCGHTYLLPVAVCGEGSVSSPPQRCSVVIEVASRVHLVLDTEKKTCWLESDLGPLKTTLPSVVAKPEQNQAYIFKIHLQTKTDEPKIQWKIYRSCLFVPLIFLVTAYWAFMWQIKTAHFIYAKSWYPQYKKQPWAVFSPHSRYS